MGDMSSMLGITKLIAYVLFIQQHKNLQLKQGSRASDWHVPVVPLAWVSAATLDPSMVSVQSEASTSTHGRSFILFQRCRDPMRSIQIIHTTYHSLHYQ